MLICSRALLGFFRVVKELTEGGATRALLVFYREDAEIADESEIAREVEKIGLEERDELDNCGGARSKLDHATWQY